MSIEIEKNNSLQGRITLVTGAAGGIGSSISTLFKKESAVVIALDKVMPIYGDFNFQCDLSDDEAMATLITKIKAEIGHVDIIVHAAAISELATITESSTDSFKRIYDVNVCGALRLIKGFVPEMVSKKSGVLLMISSINAQFATPGMGAYACSKAAIDSLTKTLALELAEHNVRVNAIAPASIDTPLLNESFSHQKNPEQAKNSNISRHPLGRLGTPDDVAKLALFLCSKDSNWITGGIHLLDGGAHITRR